MASSCLSQVSTGNGVVRRKEKAVPKNVGRLTRPISEREFSMKVVQWDDQATEGSQILTTT